jgi:S1-C subfamily serine protease
MDALDFVLLALAVAAAVGGYRLGFLGRAASWVGLAAGFYLGVRLTPVVMGQLAGHSVGIQLAVGILLVVGAAMIGQALGLVVGTRLHAALPMGPVRQADRLVGAWLGVVGVMAVLWLLLPSLASAPGWVARQTTASRISRWVSRDLPSPPNALQVLRRLVAQDAPQVFAQLGPGPSVGPVPASSPLSQVVTRSVEASTVKVAGQACGFIYEGSGFAVAPDLVVTNAHVVAGEQAGSTYVLLPSGHTLPAMVVMFDPNRDIALLEVPSLGESPLPLGQATTGLRGAVFGHPEGQDPIAVTPARVADNQTAVGWNIYDSHETRRDILVLAASLAHGDSGGPLVDASGAVVGVAFAISPDQNNVSYALAISELQAALSEPRDPNGASTGSCLNS